MRTPIALAAVALVLAPVGAVALDPDRKMTQYHHTGWTEAQGAPGPIFQVAQSAEGHLFLASGEGLFRFDGWRFERLDPDVDLTEHGAPTRMVVARSGEVWISYRKSGRLATYRNGRLRLVVRPHVDGEVMALAETPDGAIWAGVGQHGRPLLRYLAGKWQRVHLPAELGPDYLLTMEVAADGALWLSYIDRVLRLPAGSTRFQQVLGAPYSAGRLAVDPAGRVWVNETRGSHPISGPGGRWPWKAEGPFLPTQGGPRRGKPMFDRDGNLWLTSRNTGLDRVARPGVVGPNFARPADIDRFGEVEGLSSDSTGAIFEDREGTIWVGTAGGLDRFRPAAVISEGALKSPAGYGDVLLSASDGSVYIAQSSIVYRVAPRGLPEPILTDMPEPQGMCEGPDKTIWMIFVDRVIGWRGGAVGRLPKPSSADIGTAACAFDRQGRFWMSVADQGLYFWQRDRWQEGPRTAGAVSPSTALIADKRNEVWTISASSELRPLDRPSTLRVDLAAAGVDQVESFNASTRGLLIGAGSGIGEFRDGRFVFAKGKQVSPLLGATGLIETPQGEIWTMSPRGLARTRRAELERAFADPGHVVDVRLFGLLDGLADRFQSQSIRSLVQGGDGRIWIATTGGTVWVDPARIPSNPAPPPVAITMVEAGGMRHRDPGHLDLAAGTSELVFDFAVLSHAMPERAGVRYKLHGFDDRWIDPGTRRQAFYTNLPPGDYRFQVIAANEDGVWNRAGAQVEVEIPPTFVQSGWFTLLCVLAALAALWLVYKARIRQVGRRIRAVLEERLAERERIARELHDTLLQSVQGLILSFQAATEQLQPGDPKRGALERTLQRADDVLAEGRDRVHLLRSARRSEPLDAALTRLLQDCGAGPGLSTNLVVTGASRPIPPAIEDEVVAVASEALRNVVRHARATAVRVELGYGTHGLTLSIADDGVGLPPSVQAMGSPAGHFGLTGMRERAAEIGGTCRIETSPGAGTAITLSVPAKIAYRSAGGTRLQAVWARLRPQEAHA